MEQVDLLHPDAIIEYAAGEICVAPNQEEIFSVLEKYTSTIITNAGVYSPGLAKLIKAGKVREMLVSLDAGTPQTFRAIKGDAGNFEDVKENLANYIGLGAKVNLKYIFMDGVNDNTEDVEGFVTAAKELGVSRIFIAKDYRKGVVSASKNLFALMKRMVKAAHRNGLEAIPASGFFTNDEITQLFSPFPKEDAALIATF